MNKNQFESILFNYFLNENSTETNSTNYNILMSEFTQFLGSDFTDMIDYNQMAPHHDRDLWKHTQAFIAAVPIAGKEYNLSASELELLTIVGFFHDFGKPKSMIERKFDNVPLLPDSHPSRRFQTPTENGLSQVILHSFPNHAERSREITSAYLKTLNYPEAYATQILFYVAHHDDFMRIKTVNDDSIQMMAKIAYRLFNDAISSGFEISARSLRLLMLIGKCDSYAQAKEIYEFNRSTNTFPTLGEPSDTLQRKIKTYSEIENALPRILQAAQLIPQASNNSTIVDALDRIKKEFYTTPAKQDSFPTFE